MMNLTQNPTPQQLQALLATANDDTGHHILWVDKKGKVHLTLLREGLKPAGWEEGNKDNIQFRFHSFGPDDGMVGPKAAADLRHVDWLYRELLHNWHNGGRELVGMV